MNRHSFLSLPVLFRAWALLLAFGVTLSLATPAQAGFGDLVKKAKDKATKKAEAPEEATPGEEEVVFDSAVLELTEERLGGVLHALNKAKAVIEGRKPLVAKVEQANEARGAHMEKHEDKIRDIQNKRGDVESCRAEGYQKMYDLRTKEYADKALTDPTIREKFTRIAQENNAAAMRGDSTAIKRAQDAMMAVMLPTREDTLEVQRKCGPLPPQSPAEAALAKLDADLEAANEKLRDYDKKSTQAQAKDSGMNEEQFGIALERIRNYLAWRGDKKKSNIRGFSEEEIEAMEKRLAEVKSAAY